MPKPERQADRDSDRHHEDGGRVIPGELIDEPLGGRALRIAGLNSFGDSVPGSPRGMKRANALR